MKPRNKLSHEELCDLWAKARVASIKDCKWLMSKLKVIGNGVIADPFKLARLQIYTNVWGRHMEQEYGEEAR